MSLKDKMCHSLNLEHNEDIDYLTLSLREQMIVSHEYGSSLGELLLIQGSMLNLEHNEDIDYLTLSLREQMNVSHKYGSSLGELLLIQGSMRKFVKFLVQFNSKN